MINKGLGRYTLYVSYIIMSQLVKLYRYSFFQIDKGTGEYLHLNQISKKLKAQENSFQRVSNFINVKTNIGQKLEDSCKKCSQLGGCFTPGPTFFFLNNEFILSSQHAQVVWKKSQMTHRHNPFISYTNTPLSE